jgi:hypothetical protein
MTNGGNTLLITAGLGLGALILTQSASAQPGCVDTTWTCDITDGLEHSDCGNTRISTPCGLAYDASEMIAGRKTIDLRYDVNNDGIVNTDDVTLLKNGTPLRMLAPVLLLSGTYLNVSEIGNIYSPEIDITNNRMYFGGWYNNADYPDDAVYATDLNNITNVRKIIQVSGKQVNDPSIVNNKMYMTYSPDPSDWTKQYIALSTTSTNGATWSTTTQVIPAAWLPSAVLTDNLYVYYTHIGNVILPTGTVTTQLRRATLNTAGDAIQGVPVAITFDEPNFYPINVCVKYYDGMYYLLGDYCQGHCSTNCGCEDTANPSNSKIYSIGLWTSYGGVDFTAYPHNPIIAPSDSNIIARTPYFIKEGNKLRIWYGQQKPSWWTNAIYYVEYTLS